MINPTGNSLLAAQIYGSAAQRAGGPDVQAPRRQEFQDSLDQAAAAKGSSRSFPADRIEISERTNPATRDAEQVRSAEEGAQQFAREAPGTSQPRYQPPGSQLDITI